jgi:hypothetical protein
MRSAAQAWLNRNLLRCFVVTYPLSSAGKERTWTRPSWASWAAPRRLLFLAALRLRLRPQLTTPTCCSPLAHLPSCWTLFRTPGRFCAPRTRRLLLMQLKKSRLSWLNITTITIITTTTIIIITIIIIIITTTTRDLRARGALPLDGAALAPSRQGPIPWVFLVPPGFVVKTTGYSSWILLDFLGFCRQLQSSYEAIEKISPFVSVPSPKISVRE